MSNSRIVSIVAALILSAAGCHSSKTPAPKAQAKPKTPITSPATYAEADDLHEMLDYIASDELEGRGLLTVGLNRAADYIADQFHDAGLKPLPTLGSYFQPFTVTAGTSLGEGSGLVLADEYLLPGKDFMPLGFSASGTFAAPIAFVGYSISSDKFKYDDFAGIDVQGKIALAIRYEPANNKDGKSYWEPEGYSPEATFTAKAKAAEAHGAVALLICNSDGEDRVPSRLRGGEGFESAHIPVIQITRAAADRLVRRADSKGVDDLQDEIDKGPKPHSFELNGVRGSGTVTIVRDQRITKNVIGYLPGKGSHKNEFIIVGAHYDHLGRGEPGSLARNSHEIHNGADDNGSGTVAVIELAKKMARSGARDRSILFITFSGEERGLLGSSYFVNHPPVPLQMIIAMLNLDMVGRMRNDALLVSGQGTAQGFESLVEKSDKGSPIALKVADPTLGGKGGMGPSDHESFALKKIPVLFLTSGMHRDYHRPTDDVQKINFVGLAETVNLSERIVDRLVKMKRTAYVDKYDRSMMGRGGPGGNNVQLGIMPDYMASDESGVRVGGVLPDTAAAAAGLKEGDVITNIGGEKVENLGDFMTIMGKHKAGDVVKIDVMRNHEKMQLEATLKERKG